MSVVERFMVDSSTGEEAEILKFGMERIRVALIGLAAIILTGLVFGEFMETVFFIICLLPLRQNAGGYHFSNKWICAACSYAILLFSILVLRSLTVGWILALPLSLLNTGLILVLAPVGSPNHVLDELEIKVYGDRTKIICIIEFVMFLILCIIGYSRWYMVIMLSELITAALLVIGRIQENVGGKKGK